MKPKVILARSIEIVTFLFSAFGHFLTRIAPPDFSGLSFAVGFVSLTSLAILLIISLVSKNLSVVKRRKAWLKPGIILVFVGFTATSIYWVYLHKLTFPYPPNQSQERHVGGFQLTPAAQLYLKAHPNLTSAEIVADFGGLPMKTKVWSEESIDNAETVLTVNYIFLVLSLASAIFCLLEGLVVNSANQST